MYLALKKDFCPLKPEIAPVPSSIGFCLNIKYKYK